MLRKWGGGDSLLSPQAEMSASLRVTCPLHAIPNSTSRFLLLRFGPCNRPDMISFCSC